MNPIGVRSTKRTLHFGKQAGTHQQPAQLDALRGIDGQDIDGCSANRRSTDQHRADPGEVVVPHVLARVEQTREQTGCRIKPRDIGSLVEIVVQARQGQIFRNGCSVVLLSDRVVDLERENVEPVREPAVFASARRASTWRKKRRPAAPLRKGSA